MHGAPQQWEERRGITAAKDADGDYFNLINTLYILFAFLFTLNLMSCVAYSDYGSYYPYDTTYPYSYNYYYNSPFRYYYPYNQYYYYPHSYRYDKGRIFYDKSKTPVYRGGQPAGKGGGVYSPKGGIPKGGTVPGHKGGGGYYRGKK